ncbi:MAG: fluoride efflux transporter FluC [Pikeienuella sp.]
MVVSVFYVAAGGALGAVLRYLCVLGASRAFGAAFPFGVLGVNVIGSLLMGVAAVMLVEKTGAGRGSLFLMTGVLGGFTTFSAFSLDTMSLIERGATGLAALYVGGSVVLSIAAIGLGLWLGREFS